MAIRKTKRKSTKRKSTKRKSTKRKSTKRKRKQKGGYSAQTDSADAVLTNYHENTKTQREIQSEMNNQHGGKKMKGGAKETKFADITSTGSDKVIQQQIEMQNTMEQANHEDSLAHCSDGSCQGGGRKKGRKRKTHKMKKHKGKVEKKTKKSKKGKKKRKLNQFFVLMLDAKKKGLSSFKYNGNTYVGKKHKRLGMIYKKK